MQLLHNHLSIFLEYKVNFHLILRIKNVGLPKPNTQYNIHHGNMENINQFDGKADAYIKYTIKKSITVKIQDLRGCNVPV